MADVVIGECATGNEFRNEQAVGVMDDTGRDPPRRQAVAVPLVRAMNAEVFPGRTTTYDKAGRFVRSGLLRDDEVLVGDAAASGSTSIVPCQQESERMSSYSGIDSAAQWTCCGGVTGGMIPRSVGGWHRRVESR